MKVVKSLVAIGLLTTLAVPSADARPLVVRTSTVLTDNCNDPAAAGVPAGLCQAAGNATQPGGNNPDVIRASITLADNGLFLVGSGFGTGFRNGRTYVSLIYLNPTVQTCARFPVGQAANTANTANADNDFVSMFLGVWNNRPDGTGVFEVYPGKTTPLGRAGNRGLAAYGTASIREAAGGFLTAGGAATITNNIAAGRDIPPNIFALRACGSLVAG